MTTLINDTIPSASIMGQKISSSLTKMTPVWFTRSTEHTIRPWMKYLGAAILIFTVVMIGMYWRTIGDNDASLYGFWEVDNAFADRAHLDAMYIFIHPPNGDASKSIGPGGKNLAVYMFLKADGETKVNQVIDTRISRVSIRSDTIQKYKLDFGAPVSIIPKSIACDYDPVTQMLILRDSKQTYARLFKRPEISFYCASDNKKSNAGKRRFKSSTRDPADVEDDDQWAAEFNMSEDEGDSVAIAADETVDNDGDGGDGD